MLHTLQIGSIRCHILSDGKHWIDGGGFFGVVPRILWQRVAQPDANNNIPSDDRCLLIESDAGLILVDTGYGDKLDAKLRARLGLMGRSDRLEVEMRQLGFCPEDIAIVLLTHYHGDHAGGATRWDTPDHSPGRVIPTYANARYYGQAADLYEANHPNERTLATYFADNWQPLLDTGKLTIGDTPIQLASGVYTDFAPGHTTGIQMVWVEDGGESLLFLGDACSWAVHMNRLAWVPAFDIFPMTSIETKRRIRSQALQRNTLLIFQHDPVVAAGRLVEGKNGIEVQAEIVDVVSDAVS